MSKVYSRSLGWMIAGVAAGVMALGALAYTQSNALKHELAIPAMVFAVQIATIVPLPLICVGMLHAYRTNQMTHAVVPISVWLAIVIGWPFCLWLLMNGLWALSD